MRNKAGQMKNRQVPLHTYISASLALFFGAPGLSWALWGVPWGEKTFQTLRFKRGLGNVRKKKRNRKGQTR